MAEPRDRSWDDDADEAATYRGETRTSGKAVASFILGLLLPCNVLTGIPAIILGILGLKDIGNSRGRAKGSGLAITGIVLGSLGCVLVFPAMLLGLLLPAVQKVRESANRMTSANNLKQIGLAIHNYHSIYNQMPPAVVYNADGQPLYSWRVLLLPYLEQDSLYRQFKLDEPWDSPANRPLLNAMPRVYAHPDRTPPGPDATFYRVFVGPGAAWESDPAKGLWPLDKSRRRFGAEPKLRLQDFTDGTSNTLMVVEADEAVPWTKPDELPFGPEQPLPKLHTFAGGSTQFLFVDGSVRGFPRRSLSDQTLRGLITRNGGEVLNLP